MKAFYLSYWAHNTSARLLDPSIYVLEMRACVTHRIFSPMHSVDVLLWIMNMHFRHTDREHKRREKSEQETRRNEKKNKRNVSKLYDNYLKMKNASVRSDAQNLRSINRNLVILPAAVLVIYIHESIRQRLE